MYIDEAYLKARFGCNSEAGLPISDAQNPAGSDDYARAHTKIERLVSVRDRSVKELRRRLARDGFSQDVIDPLMDRMVASGLVNDERFAQTLIRSRLSAGKGIPGIVRELKEHDIDPSSIDGFPESFLEEAPNQTMCAVALLRRKPPRAKNLMQAAYGKLMRNGYSSDVALRATRIWMDEQAD